MTKQNKKIGNSYKNEALRPGAERTCQLIARHIEASQFCQLAELLGQFPCRKSECQQNMKPLSTDAEVTSQTVVAEVDLCHRIAELANVGRKHQPCVSFQLNGAVLDEFPAQKNNRDFT